MRRLWLAVALIVSPTLASAQAWIRPAGEIYANVGVTTMSSDGAYGADTTRQDIGATYTQTALTLYAEAGVIDRWLQISLGGELYRRNTLSGRGTTEGVGDLQAGAWVGLLQDGPVRLSAGLLVGLPTGDPTPSVEGAGGEALAPLLPTGDGEVDYEPRIIAGSSFGGGGWPLRHYAVAELGYAFRSEGIDDGVRYRLELGSQLPRWPRIWLMTRIHGLRSLASEAEAGQEGLRFSGLGQGVSYGALGVELYGRIVDQLGISVATDMPFEARNIVAGLPVRAALSYTF